MPKRVPMARSKRCEVGLAPALPKRDALAARVRATWRWAECSRNFRSTHPLCCDPFKRHEVMPAVGVSVHHVFPVETFPELAFKTWNLRSLCASCHNSVGALEKVNAVEARLLFIDATEQARRLKAEGLIA